MLPRTTVVQRVLVRLCPVGCKRALKPSGLQTSAFFQPKGFEAFGLQSTRFEALGLEALGLKDLRATAYGL